MKTKVEIQTVIAEYKAELDELGRVREHCAQMKWWSIVSEIKKVENIRSRDKRQLEAILA
jgi:hypothetical protein